MSERCCIDPGAPQLHQAAGNEENIAGLNTYRTGSGRSVIVIFTDVFGYNFINTRKIADTFAQAVGTTVLVPDFFNEDPLDPTATNLQEQMPIWRQKHPVEDACASAANYISTIKGHYDSIQVMHTIQFRPRYYDCISFVDYWFLLWRKISSPFDY